MGRRLSVIIISCRRSLLQVWNGSQLLRRGCDRRSAPEWTRASNYRCHGQPDGLAAAAPPGTRPSDAVVSHRANRELAVDSANVDLLAKHVNASVLLLHGACRRDVPVGLVVAVMRYPMKSLRRYRERQDPRAVVGVQQAAGASE